MKYAFSTLSCPGWSVARSIRAACDYGYDALELRLMNGEVIDPVRQHTAIVAAVRDARAAGLEVCALDSSVRVALADHAARGAEVDVLRRWIELASATQVPMVRVFGAGTGEAAGADREAIAVETLSAVAPAAESAGVIVALETHDVFASARAVQRVLDAVPSPAVAALWDSLHPFAQGESVEDTFGTLAARCALVHVKDARRDGTGWTLVPVGAGEVPIAEIVNGLVERGYDGYVSVEWEKKWHPELAEPEVALPQHLAYLKAILRRRKNRREA